MGVNYCGILNLEKVGFYYCGNLLRYLFYNIGPWGQFLQHFWFQGRAIFAQIIFDAFNGNSIW